MKTPAETAAKITSNSLPIASKLSPRDDCQTMQFGTPQFLNAIVNRQSGAQEAAKQEPWIYCRIIPRRPAAGPASGPGLHPHPCNSRGRISCFAVGSLRRKLPCRRTGMSIPKAHGAPNGLILKK
jgi:hypothetical protein